MECYNLSHMMLKYGVGKDKMLIIASMSGTKIDWKKDTAVICGVIDENLVNRYKEILNGVNNNKIVEVDSNMISLFKDFKIINAYNKLFVTRMIPIRGDMVKYADRKQIVYFANRYYVPPEVMLDIKAKISAEKKRKNVIVIDDIDTE